ncbi:MAG: signal peptide peptidase SppA [Bacteroidales bacterium]|nr:signal peptide peptidase SppA [Bacteroidales bacterium]
MKSFFKIVFGSMVGFLLFALLWMFIILAIVGGVMASLGDETHPPLKEPTILNVELTTGVAERVSNNPMNYLKSGSKNKPTDLNTLLKAIRRAKTDDQIAGIVFRPGLNAGISAANTEELRAALADFKESGKFIYAYADMYAQNLYWLATVADTIALQPEGSVDFRGISMDIMFYKELLNKIGVDMQILRHGKFKSAVEPYIQNEMSPANREQYERLAHSIWNRIAEDVAAGRNLSRAAVDEAASEVYGMFPEQALAHGMIDLVTPEGGFTAILLDKMDVEEEDDLKTISISDYAAIPEPMVKTTDKIAVIYANGEIGMGKGSETEIGTENIVKALKEAADDEKVKAIVLRVNSPGGSVLTSDIIYHEVLNAKAKKPLIASFGSYAASGGYYISCAADHIFAQPTTLTGSIGVFGMIPNIGKTMRRIGVHTDGVKTHPYAGSPSLMRAMTPGERALQQSGIENIYAGFIGKVAKGRGMSTAAVDSIGQGRVWSGTDGLRVGLVDELGGLEDAIAYAADKAGLEQYKVAEYPKQKSTYEVVMESLTEMRTNKVTRALTEEVGPEAALLYRTVNDVKKANGMVVWSRMPYGLVTE